MNLNDHILTFLQTRGHGGATVREIQTHTGMPYRQTYQLMRRLLKLGKVGGHRYGAIWVFHAR